MISSSPAKPDRYFTGTDQQVLVKDFDKQNHKIQVSLPHEKRVSIFCRRYTFRQMLVWDGPSGAAGFHVSCLNSLRKNRKLVIWLHGGPWTRASKDLVLEQLAFLDAGYDLFIPLYAGSADRPIKFEGPVMVPDAVDALAEVKAAFGWGRRHYNTVDVFGESFGAFLVASLAPELKEKSTLFLHNPSLGGKRRLEEIYAGLPDDQLMEGAPKERARAEVKRITDAYFGRLKNYVPIRLLESTNTLKLKLVHGGRDKLMEPDEIQRLARLAVPGCGVDYRPDNGHESGKTPEQFESFRNLIHCEGPSGPSDR